MITLDTLLKIGIGLILLVGEAIVLVCVIGLLITIIIWFINGFITEWRNR